MQMKSRRPLTAVAVVLGLAASDFDRPYWPVVTIDYNGTPASNPYFGSILVAGYAGGTVQFVVVRGALRESL